MSKISISIPVTLQFFWSDDRALHATVHTWVPDYVRKLKSQAFHSQKTCLFP